jgi:hypothetical protein
VWFKHLRFLSESYKCNWLLAGLLTYSLFAGLPMFKQWLLMDKKFGLEITAAVTVQDFHPIPS